MNRAICGHCHHFTLTDAKPDEGIGRCLGFGENPVEPFVRWDRKFCVLFGPAPDMPKRVQWIKKREREEGGNVAAAC